MRTDTVEAITTEVGEVVDAAGADPRRWQDVLEAMTRRMPGTKAALQVIDRRAVRGIPMLAAGFEAGVVEAYAERYGAENPWAPLMIAMPDLGLVHSEEVMPARSFAHTAFYADWLSRGGGIDASTALKIVDADGRLGFACLHFDARRAEPANRVAAPVLAALGARMRDALTLNGVSAGLGGEGLEFLDAVAEPALIVTAALRIVAVNGPARALLAEGRAIDAGIDDALAVPDSGLRRALEAEVARACGRPVAFGAAPVAPPNGYAVSALRVRPGALRAGLGPLLWGGPLALVVLRRTAPAGDLGPVLARAYRLTPAETRLALAVGGSRSLREVAGALGVGYATARSQLKSVFLKTGTSRQAELVALLLHSAATWH